MKDRAKRAGLTCGFTLIELLVVVAIVALLLAILLPSLQSAREEARASVCGTNLRAVGQGMMTYTAEYQAFPASYIYDGMDLDLGAGTQGPSFAANGYLHWSWFLYSIKSGPPQKAFKCPSLTNGGLPATNPDRKHKDPGQDMETPNVVDKQAHRMAYTANEAVCPRNKFVQGFQGALRTYHYVQADVVRDTSDVVLATEFYNDWRIVSGINRNGSGNTKVCKSHRPIHGFTGFVTLDMDQALPFRSIGRISRQAINPTPEPDGATSTRLDWVGRNHNGRKRTNFLYCDGHVERKTIEKTVPALPGEGRGEWGEYFYSLENGRKIAGEDD
jgi:prepilin-type N-terminal cleavage/methylation domain-containing protein/prepilin-type processing-associated H-X9-DG protein